MAHNLPNSRQDNDDSLILCMGKVDEEEKEVETERTNSNVIILCGMVILASTSLMLVGCVDDSDLDACCHNCCHQDDYLFFKFKPEQWNPSLTFRP